MKVLLFGYFGFGNFGDELILKSADKLLSSQHQVSVVVSRKLKLKNKNKKYIRRGFFRILEAVIDHDVLLFPGGSVFQDKSSPLSPLYYAFWALTAKMFKKKLILAAQGIGPLQRRINLIITRKVFQIADFVSLRDELSAQYCRKNRIRYDQVGSDIVWSLLEKSTADDKDLDQSIFLGRDVYRYTIPELMGMISRSKVVCSDKYHVILVAALLGAEVAIIGSDPKLRALAADLAVGIYPEYNELIEAKSPSNIGLMKKRSTAILQQLVKQIQ